MKLVPVPAPYVEAQWPRVRVFVTQACRKGPLDADPEALKAGCLTRDHQLWLIENEAGEAVAVVITQVVGGVCEWLAVGGLGMSHWKHLEHTIELWAKAEGCLTMRSFSRIGMRKRLPEYRVRGVILEKAI